MKKNLIYLLVPLFITGIIFSCNNNDIVTIDLGEEQTDNNNGEDDEGEKEKTPRDSFVQPFTANSPWNHPIGNEAAYAAIQGLDGLHGGINFDGAWTTGIYKATEDDRKAKLYICNNDAMWWFIAGGEYIMWVWNNDIGDFEEKLIATKDDPNIEDVLRQNTQMTPRWACNSYSTTSNTFPDEWVLPTDIRLITEDWPEDNEIYVPTDARPSPDSDTHIAIYQPNGLVMEAYNAVILGNGDIVCQIASFTDPRSEGTGYQNGRLASLIPNYAGKIKQSEIVAGKIPHAMCITVPPSILSNKHAWPAYAFDRSNKYTGTTIPMGALLALPANLNIDNLNLNTAQGKAIAKAAQDYGCYITDGGGDNGITFQAELGANVNNDAMHDDLTKIIRNLKWISNNGPDNRGGGGTPRQPMASELE
jgi:hypothetical protein